MLSRVVESGDILVSPGRKMRIREVQDFAHDHLEVFELRTA